MEELLIKNPDGNGSSGGWRAGAVEALLMQRKSAADKQHGVLSKQDNDVIMESVNYVMIQHFGQLFAHLRVVRAT